MPPPSQDLDARFAVFLNPIRDLTKNWEVDIAKYLEDYLAELSEVQITFDDGETVMNFAEAAMLIQGSATVYSKKVEFLWQMVLQMIDLLSSKKAFDEGAGATKDGGKSRPSKHNLSLEFEEIEGLPPGKNIYLREEDDVVKPLKFLPAIPLHLVDKESEKSGCKIVLYLKNLEAIGNKDDFRINRSYLSSYGVLSLDLPSEVNGEGESGLDKSFMGFNISTFSCLNQNEDIDADLPDDDIDHGGETSFPETHFENPDDGPIVTEDAPVPRSCNADPADDAELANHKGSDVESEGKRQGLRMREAKDNIAELNLKDPLKPLDPHVETPAKRPIRAGRIRKPAPCNCHKAPAKTTSRLRSKALKEKINNDASNEMAKEKLSVEDFLNQELMEFLLNKNNNNLKNKLPFPVDPRLVQELANEEAKKLDILKAKNIKEILAKEGGSVTEDEAKERVEETTLLRQQMESRLADEYQDDAVPDIDFDEIGRPELELPEPHKAVETPYGVFKDEDDKGAPNKSWNDTLLYEPSSDYEALVQKWVSDYINKAQEHVNSSELSRKVNRWRKHIMPIIHDEEERKLFDIHDYGSSVLSRFPDEIDEPILFDDLFRGQESREVCRTFLSCLMLANTYNIELSEAVPGPLSMDCLQLKLLSKVRHHENIEQNFTGSPSRKKKRTKRKSMSPCSVESGDLSPGTSPKAKKKQGPKSPKSFNKKSKRK